MSTKKVTTKDLTKALDRCELVMGKKSIYMIFSALHICADTTNVRQK